jgi:hypothetical protein
VRSLDPRDVAYYAAGGDDIAGKYISVTVGSAISYTL